MIIENLITYFTSQKKQLERIIEYITSCTYSNLQGMHWDLSQSNLK